ncbi:hypothetical protein E4T50_04904 [Aureobasidium sp. EXF-12298]|nr:hypothetical protein E4T50_04904 [Aureobasidium sp. EXF-12298]KAI4763058.1 hypothetical protein E4T51_03932 [Aureobasidium sp. EXF-12344]KAI4780267.1 hypothetical protein E4T52_04793 [Aureobasidium sp. EXF-3400]
MATPGKSEVDPKITAYLDFVAQLIRRLDSGNVNAVTMKELDTTLKVKCPRSPAAKAAEFDRLGTQIWNAAIRLKDQSSPMLKTWPQLESQLRVLAYFLLDTAQRSYVKHGSKKSSQNLVRILKTALKAARICIASNALDLCTMLFEKMAEHVEHKQDPPPEYKKDKQKSEAQEMIKELTADYYLLRATTSWKQNKPDTVSYWLARVLLLPNRSDMLHLAEKKADLTYEVGKSALQQKQFASAVRWLEQSYQIFEDIDPEILSSDLCDLRLVVMLDYGDVTAARAAYHQMSDSGKSAATTQYLMYKIALQENDIELAMRHGSSFKDADNDDTCVAELRWFACHCYNTALKYCSDMQPELLTRYMMASVALIDLLRKEGENDDGLLTRLLLCRFLAASALIVMARSEDNIERALQLYLDARRQIAAFYQRYQEAEQNGWLQPDASSDIEVKEFEMIQFDLEALMRLENWQDLDKVLSMCLESRHSNRLENAADLILHIHTNIVSSAHPTTSNLLARIPSVMEKIINTCWRNNKDITRLARWIRCLFQMTMTTNFVISLRCLDQASAIASKAATQQIPEAYPQEELEWLASTAFNHAVDLWFADAEEEANGQEEGTEQARVWAEKSLMLAGSVSGVGDGTLGLHKVLQDKWMKLKGMGQSGGQ